MRDHLFFPLALLLAAGMVVLAVLPARGALPSGPISVGNLDYSEITVDGVDLNRIQTGGDADITLVRLGPTLVLQVATRAGALSEDPLLGPHFPLAADIEAQFAGFPVEVTVRARPGLDGGAMQMQANYAARSGQESGWQVFDLKPEFADFTFRYKVPERSGEPGLDYLAIRPVTPEKRRGILVEHVTFRRLPRGAEAE